MNCIDKRAVIEAVSDGCQLGHALTPTENMSENTMSAAAICLGLCVRARRFWIYVGADGQKPLKPLIYLAVVFDMELMTDGHYGSFTPRWQRFERKERSNPDFGNRPGGTFLSRSCANPTSVIMPSPFSFLLPSSIFLP